MNILFLLSQQPNPRFVKQINFLAKTNKVFVLFFSREQSPINLENEVNKTVKYVELGKISNRKYIYRIFKLLTYIKIIKYQLKGILIDTVIFNHIDVLFLSKSYNLFYNNIRRAKRVLEIADLRELSFKNNIQGKIYRLIEKGLIKKTVNSLILTSKKFFDNYYSNYFTGNVFILENKPLSYMLPEKLDKKKSDKLRVAAVGGFRGKTTELALETIKNLDGVEFRIHGFGENIEKIKDYALKYNNINYFGPFNFFKDIAQIYAEIDVLYVVYDTFQSENMKLALPNKLYEALYFKIPLIVSKGTYLEEFVKKYKIGYAINCLSKDELIEVLNKIKANKEILFSNLNNVPKKIYIADNDYEELKMFLYV